LKINTQVTVPPNSHDGANERKKYRDGSFVENLTHKPYFLLHKNHTRLVLLNIGDLKLILFRKFSKD
jgi:hypothetical protein